MRQFFLSLLLCSPVFATAYPICLGYGNLITFTYDPSGASLGGSLSGFPDLFYITDAKLKTAANGGAFGNVNGWDMCLANAADTASFPFQIESYDGAAGKLWMYFRPTTTLTTAVTYHLWVGKVVSSDPSSTAVWTTNYSRVMLLQENGTPNGSGAGIYANKTGGASSVGGTNPTRVTGLLGFAQSFNPASLEWISVPTALPSGNGTIQVTANGNTQIGQMVIWSGQPIGCGGSAGNMTLTASGFLTCFNGTNVATGTVDVRTSTHVLACQYGTNNTQPFVDGVAQGTPVTGNQSQEANPAEIGKNCNSICII